MSSPVRKRVFYVEGNISSSKTTVLAGLREAGVAVYEEPLHIWKERYVEKNGDNILGLFYADMARWSFQFEVAVMTTRIQELERALKDPAEIVVVERSIFTDFHVFAPNLYAEGKMTDAEWKIYEDWYNLQLRLVLKPLVAQADVSFIFIDTDAETCHARKIGRDRKEEKLMPPDYLIQLQKRHENWLLDVDFPHPMHRVDGHGDEQEVLQQVLKVIGHKPVAIADQWIKHRASADPK